MVVFVVTGAKPNSQIGVVEVTFNAEFTPNAASLPICPVETASVAPRTHDLIEALRDSYPMYFTLARESALQIATQFKSARPKHFEEAIATFRDLLAPHLGKDSRPLVYNSEIA